MGSEQSTERKEKKDDEYQRKIHQILEQQRKIYEANCKELLERQQKGTLIAREAKELNARNVPRNTTLATQSPTNTCAPLYPNLSQTPEHIHIQPSTSRTFYNAGHINNSHILRTSSPRPDPQCDTNYNIQPSAPAASIASEPAQLKPRSQKTNSNRIGEWRCLSCNNNFGTKIFNCKQGHSSCSDCKLKGNKCGICRNSLTDTRNISLENYIAEIKSNVASDTEIILSCPNKSDGCKLSLKQDKMENHLKECPFREMTCPAASLYATCSWQGKINHLRGHFLDCHPQITGTDVDTEVNFNVHGKNQLIHHVVLGNFHFLVHLKFDANSQTVYMIVQLIGSRNSASKWTYEFHVYDKSEPRRKYLYADVCHPNNIPFSDLCNESKCAVLQYQYAMSFVKDNILTYKFYIKKDDRIDDRVKRGGPNRGRGGRRM